MANPNEGKYRGEGKVTPPDEGNKQPNGNEGNGEEEREGFFSRIFTKAKLGYAKFKSHHPKLVRGVKIAGGIAALGGAGYAGYEVGKSSVKPEIRTEYMLLKPKSMSDEDAAKALSDDSEENVENVENEEKVEETTAE